MSRKLFLVLSARILGSCGALMLGSCGTPPNHCVGTTFPQCAHIAEPAVGVNPATGECETNCSCAEWVPCTDVG